MIPPSGRPLVQIERRRDREREQIGGVSERVREYCAWDDNEAIVARVSRTQ